MAMENEKKLRITKKITRREYMSILWIFENLEEYKQTGKVNYDFNQFDDAALSEQDKFSFRVTKDEKKIIDKYLDNFVGYVSLGAYAGTVKKNKRTE